MSTTKRHICIHGHFYQPPRENAWLEDVELQDSAYPYHDWNERITDEGYAPNTAARILDGQRRIIDIVNNYERISFNFGPTLLSWIEGKRPEVYAAILEADKRSREHFDGHGSALAQVYNHMIMPLANGRDKRTQVLWGLRDFELRFGRKPEGMWLPETAVDLESLDLLAEQGITFTILSPYQAHRVRKIDGKNWRDVSGGNIDPKHPYLCKLPSGRDMVLFFYDGPISQDVGFGGILNNGEAFANRLVEAFADADGPQLVHIATDGETYGHHKPHGDMALAYCLYHIETNQLAEVTIYGACLEKNPPTHEVEIYENSSWSCVHGVERWRSDCGCNSGRGDWHQAWRAPLREALDWLRDQMIPLYEREAGELLQDPWGARDDFIRVVLDRSPENVQRFLSEHSRRELSGDDQIKALKLLEMQRHAMLMYTSCGWFFDKISGIETTQVMQYAARAIQLTEEACGEDFEPGFMERLARAPSNLPEHENGANVYEKFVKPARIDLLRVGVHYALSSLFEEYPESIKVYCFTAERQSYERMQAGRLMAGIGRVVVRSDITWNESDISFAVLHLGGHMLNGGVREFMGEEAFADMHQEVKNAFSRGDVPEVIRSMDDHFGMHNYSLWHLFKDEQRKVFDLILHTTLEDTEVAFRKIYQENYSIMQAMQEMYIPIPQALATPRDFVLNADLKKELDSDEVDLEKLDQLVQELKKWSVEPDKTLLNYVAAQRIQALMEALEANPEQIELIQKVRTLIGLLDSLPLELDLWEAQNIYFAIGKQRAPEMRERAEAEEAQAQTWLEEFGRLGDYLRVKVW